MDVATIALSAFNTAMTAVFCAGAMALGAALERHYPAHVAVAQHIAVTRAKDAHRHIRRRFIIEEDSDSDGDALVFGDVKKEE